MKREKKELLEERIQKVLSEKEEALEDVYSKSLEELIEELKVYQYELEFQNDELKRTQLELEKSRAEYIELFENAPLGYVVIDHEMKLADYNSLFRQIAEVSVSDQGSLKGLDFRKFIAPSDQDAFYHFFEELLSSDETVETEIRLNFREEKPVVVRISGKHSNSEGGDKIPLFLKDVTDLTESEEERKAILDTVQDGFFVASMDARILAVNESMCKMLGYSREEFLSMRISDIEAKEDEEDIRDHIDLILERGYDRFETHHRTKDGVVIDVEISVSYLKSGEGKLVVFARNITETKKMFLDLRDSEEKFRQITESIGEVFWLRSGDGLRIEYINPAYEMIWGRSCESLYENPNSFIESVHPDDRKSVEVEFVKYQNEGLFDLEYRILKPDGELRWVHAKTFPVFNDKGELIRHTGVASDITERKLAEENLRKSLEEVELYRTFIESSGDCFYMVDLDDGGKMSYVNEAAVKHYSASREEILTWRIPDWDPNFTQETVSDIAKQIREVHRMQIQSRHRKADGSIVPVEITTNYHKSSEGREFAYGWFNDISARLAAEEELEQNRLRLKETIEGANVGTWEWNLVTDEIIYNERMAEMTGYTMGELESLPSGQLREIIHHPEDRAASKKLLERHFSGELRYYEFESRMKHKEGHYIWVLSRGKVARWTEEGEPQLMLGTYQDITARKQEEAYRTELLNRLQEIGKNLPGFIYQYLLRSDGTSCFPYASKGIEDIYGVSPDEVKSDASKVFEVLHPDDIERVTKTIQLSAKNRAHWKDTYRVILPTGTIWVEGKIGRAHV